MNRDFRCRFLEIPPQHSGGLSRDATQKREGARKDQETPFWVSYDRTKKMCLQQAIVLFQRGHSNLYGVRIFSLPL